MGNVIVTGGSRGLGLATARALAGAGHAVTAVARSESAELKAAAEEARAAGHGAIGFVAFDLGDIDGIAGLVRGLRKELGPIHGLVNNAGIGTEGLLAMMPNGDIERLIRINTTAPIVLSKYVVRQMMAEGAGRIVNMSSIIASTGYSALSVYAATKASLVGFTKSLAREVGQLGITVNAVAPGFIETELTGSLGDAEKHRVAKRSALRRLAEPRDVADAVEFLLSDKARNITGTVLTVDAGGTA